MVGLEHFRRFRRVSAGRDAGKEGPQIATNSSEADFEKQAQTIIPTTNYIVTGTDK